MEAPEAVLDVHDGFFTGFSSGNGTRPGFVVKNETFKLRFEEIQVEKLCSETQMRFVKSRFESCYGLRLGEGYGDDSRVSRVLF